MVLLGSLRCDPPLVNAQLIDHLGLYGGRADSSFEEVVNQKPDHYLRHMTHYRQDNYCDPHICDYLKSTRQLPEFDWDAVLRGETILPYTHTDMSNRAWMRGIAKCFPARSAVHELYSEHADDFDLAFEWTLINLYSVCGGSRVCTHDEVLKDMNLNGSCGFPWNKVYPSKREAFSDPTFIDYLDLLWHQTGEGISEKFYFQFCLKDEFRDTNKVNDHKTRVFCAGPVDLNYVCARLFKDMADKLTASDTTASAIGTRQTNLDFHDLWQAFQVHEVPGNLDADGWDNGLHLFLFCFLLMFSWEFLDPVDRTFANWNRLVIIIRESVLAYVLAPNGAVWVADGGMRSGLWITAFGNTIIHIFCRFYYWLRSGGPRNYAFYIRHETNKFYGDDTAYSYDPQVSLWSHPATFVEFGKELDIKYEVGEQGWEHFTFLGHRFQNIDGTVVPIRPFMAILSGWIQDGNGNWQRALERSAGYRIQAFFHPRLYDAITGFMVWILRTYDPKNVTGLGALLMPDSSIRRLHFHQ